MLEKIELRRSYYTTHKYAVWTEFCFQRRAWRYAVTSDKVVATSGMEWSLGIRPFLSHLVHFLSTVTSVLCPTNFDSEEILVVSQFYGWTHGAITYGSPNGLILLLPVAYIWSWIVSFVPSLISDTSEICGILMGKNMEFYYLMLYYSV
jgi:hypothetical protein